MYDKFTGEPVSDSRWPPRRLLTFLIGEARRRQVPSDEIPSDYSATPWLGTAVILALATLVATSFHAIGLTEANLVMIYVLAIVIVATRYGSWASAAASVLAVVLFDVLFTSPYYAVTVHDTQYVVTFSVMLIVGLLASTLTARIRHQANVAAGNERRTDALYRLSRTLSAVSGLERLVEHAERTVSDEFDSRAVIYLPDNEGRVRPAIQHPVEDGSIPMDSATVQRVFEDGKFAQGDAGNPLNALAVCLPLATPSRSVGVLEIRSLRAGAHQSPPVQRLLQAYATQIAFAIERERLTEDSQRVRVQIESERLRSSLLSAVSHDLRTPLAGIAGSSSMLADSYESLDAATRRELLETICEESERLSRLVENLLHMTRLSSGNITVTKQWQPVDDVVGSALNCVERLLGERSVDVAIPDDLPLGHFDSVLVEQVLINLLDNAVKYSAPTAPIAIRAESCEGGIALEVADRGHGLQPGDEQRVFEMFYRGADDKPDRRGTGLGLAICRAVAEAHGGTIHASNRSGGGAVVRLVLPHSEPAPEIQMEPLTAEQH